jgi:hypothetical protein
VKTRLTPESYRDEIQAVAAWIDVEVRVHKRDRETYLRKTCEAHPWVIDLGINLEVLRITRNDHAYFTTYGPMLALSFADAVYKMAWAAFQADVSEAMYDIERTRGTLCKPV